MADDRPSLVLREQPTLRAAHLIAAFSGWPDAGEIATGALRYLVKNLGARKIGQIDAMPYVDMTTLRPLVVIEDGDIQTLRFPINELYSWQNPDGEPDVVCLLGIEPHLNWREFLLDIEQIMQLFDVRLVISLGSLFDAVPHTRPAKVSGIGSTQAMRTWMRQLDIALTDYQGPSSFHTALTLTAKERGIDAISLWGHAPHYVRTPANPKVCAAMLDRLANALEIKLDLGDLQTAAGAMDEALAKLVESNPELRSHLEALEAQPSTPAAEGEAGPDWGNASADSIIREVEAFLRSEHQEPDEGDGPPTS